MGIAFRASSAAGVQSSAQALSFNLTIPASVAAGDTMLLIVNALTLIGTPSVISVASTGTAFTRLGPIVSATTGGATVNAAVYQAVATGADAGKVITASCADNPFWGLGIAAWSGASPAGPVDVVPAGVAVAGVSSITAPSASTVTAADWAVGLLAFTISGSPPAPPSLTSRLSSQGGTNVGTAIGDSNASVGGAGTSIGGGVWTPINGGWAAAFTVALKPAGTFEPFFVSVDGNNVQTWQVNYSGQPATFPTGSPAGTGLRILPPASPAAGFAHGILYTLPVNQGFDDTTNGNGLDTVRGLAAQNTYNVTVIEPSFGISPWYADHPTDQTLQLETFMTLLRAWVATSSFASGGEKHYLIGFSKSGLGGSGLLYKHPSLWTAGAFWDFPAMMTDYDGTDPTNGGAVGGSPAFNYGTSASFQANYRLSSANITAWNTAASNSFTGSRRLWIGGRFSFGPDVTAYEALLTSLGVLYDGSWNTLDSSHAWHADWVAPALASIIHPASGSGPLTVLGIV